MSLEICHTFNVIPARRNSSQHHWCGHLSQLIFPPFKYHLVFLNLILFVYLWVHVKCNTCVSLRTFGETLSSFHHMGSGIGIQSLGLVAIFFTLWDNFFWPQNSPFYTDSIYSVFTSLWASVIKKKIVFTINKCGNWRWTSKRNFIRQNTPNPAGSFSRKS